MKSETQRTLESVSQDKCEIISLMVQYHNNELPLSCASQVERLISGCQECQRLYEEVCFFFDVEETCIFEVLNEEKVEKARRNFYNFVEKTDYYPAIKGDVNYKNALSSLDIWNKNCFCCE